MSPGDLFRERYAKITSQSTFLFPFLGGGRNQHPSQLILFYVILLIRSTAVYYFDLSESDNATLGVIRHRDRVWLSVLEALSDYKPQHCGFQSYDLRLCFR